MQDILSVIEQQTGHKVDSDTPIDSLGLDSLDFIDLLLAIERETGVVVPDSKVADIHTIADILKAAA